MICPVCGNQQNEGTECLACHTPLNQGVNGMTNEIPSSSILEMYEKEVSSPSSPAGNNKELVKKNLEDQAKMIQEQEKQIQIQLAKMEEEKQRLLELKQNHEKQMQEIKAVEEQKKAQRNESEIVDVVDKFKNILVTSLPVIENRPVLEYKGIVGSQVLIKTDTLETVVSGLKDAAGLRQTPYYDNLKKGFQIGLADLKIEASKLHANAVIGVSVHEQHLKDQVLILSFTGTAVLCQAENV